MLSKNNFHLLLIFFLSTGLFSQVEISSQEEDTDTFPQSISIGASLFGSIGIAGIPIRYNRPNGDQWEVIMAYSPISSEGNSLFISENHAPGTLLQLGYHSLQNVQDKPKRNKFIKNYICPKLGIGLSTINQIMGGMTWRRETHKYDQERFSRGIELGAAVFRRIGEYSEVTRFAYPVMQMRLLLRLDLNVYKI